MEPDAAAFFQYEFFMANPGLRPTLELMRSVPNACFFVKDLQTRYVMANALHLATYDLTEEFELVGRVAWDFFPDLLAQAWEGNDRQVLSSGETLHKEVWLVPNIRGTPRWFVSSKSPLFDMQGQIMGLASLQHPIETPEDQRTHFQELDRVIRYLKEHFVDEITLDRLAALSGISLPHFNRRFRQLLRLSPMEYILSLRVQEAQRLLLSTNQPIGEIAAVIGFYDQSHFTKRFRKVTGLTPLSYRKRFRS